MTCRTCNAQVPEGSNFCPSCGRLVATAQTAPRSKIPVWAIVLIGAAVALVIALPFLMVVAAIVIPNFIHARAESQTAADEANLKAIALGLEQYAVDHNGRYPDRLTQLSPTYINVMPMVPGTDGAGVYTYHRPAAPPAKALYDIWDDGSMDVTTMYGLPNAQRGGRCMRDCKYIVYIADKGIVGMPGSTSNY